MESLKLVVQCMLLTAQMNSCTVCRDDWQLIAILVCLELWAQCRWHQSHIIITTATCARLLQRNAYLATRAYLRSLVTRFSGVPGN